MKLSSGDTVSKTVCERELQSGSINSETLNLPTVGRLRNRNNRSRPLGICRARCRARWCIRLIGQMKNVKQKSNACNPKRLLSVGNLIAKSRPSASHFLSGCKERERKRASPARIALSGSPVNLISLETLDSEILTASGRFYNKIADWWIEIQLRKWIKLMELIQVFSIFSDTIRWLWKCTYAFPYFDMHRERDSCAHYVRSQRDLEYGRW